MGKKGPRRGSLAFWHRKRAPRLVPRIRAWPTGKGLMGFGGYKAGMTHVLMIEDRESLLKGQEVTRAVTIVETPPIFVYAIAAYKQTVFGLKKAGEIVAANAPKELSRVIPLPKKSKKTIEELEKQAQAGEFTEIRVMACTQPRRSGLGKKTPEVFELAVGGKDAAEKIAEAKKFFGKSVSASEVFKEGEFVDVIAVTRGKGWQGVVKRFGVALNPRKATKSRRHGGAIGAERQAKVMYTVPRPGQMGFHRRTDRGKRLLKLTPASELGFSLPHYGPPKTDVIVIEGSIPGPAKRFVFLRKPLVAIHARKPELKQLFKPS